MNKHFMFIYQDGWHQIVTPDGKVVNVTSCEHGYYINVDGDAASTVAELNRYSGHPIVDVLCDSACVTVGYVFVNARLVSDGLSTLIFISVKSTNGNHSEPVVKNGLVAKFEDSKNCSTTSELPAIVAGFIFKNVFTNI